MTKAKIADALLVTEITRLRLEHRRAFLQTTPNPDCPGQNAHLETAEITALQATLATPSPSPRGILTQLFDLSPAELDFLDICIAISVDSSLEALVTECQGKPWRPAPSEALIRRLCGLPPEPIWRPTSPLARWHLISEISDPAGAAPSFRADPRIVDWYFGKASLDQGLVGKCGVEFGATPTPAWDIAEEKQVLCDLLSKGTPLRLTVTGPAESGRRLLAQKLCQDLELAPLLIQGHALAGPDLEDLYIRSQRFALLTGRVPIWLTAPPTWPAFPSPVPLQILLSDGATIPPGPGGLNHVIAQPALTPALRQSYWHALTTPGAELPLVLRNATASELRALAPLARSNGDSIGLFLNQRALSDLETVGHVKRPDLNWDDIILDPDLLASLQSYASEARLQNTLLARPDVHRLYARDSAPTALFTGPPGVGKTMAAECIASELGLPLLVIDVSRTISKYIGETAKNFSSIFDRARRLGCIIFFDEADAFFAKRTELKNSQDRHANADTNHLLQLVEAYEGFVILSTNKPANIDEAFFRRIRHVIDFHRPDMGQRTTLWHHYTGVLGNIEGLQGALTLCAERFELTPAQIKAASLTAHFASLRQNCPMGLPHLLTGVARELRKDGCSLPVDLTHHLDQPLTGGAHVA